jgi:hypothetical protein
MRFGASMCRVREGGGRGGSQASLDNAVTLKMCGYKIETGPWPFQLAEWRWHGRSPAK